MKTIPRVCIMAKRRSIRVYMSPRARKLMTAKYVTSGSTIKKQDKSITRPKNMQRLRSFLRLLLRQKKKRMILLRKK